MTSNNSCTASVTNTVEVYNQPVANFSVASVCQGIATAFTDLSASSGTIQQWAWDFTNDNTPDVFNTATPTNTFASSGTFTTQLIITDSNSCKDTVNLPVNVWGHSVPNFTPDKVCYSASTQFSNLTTTTVNANTGGVLSYGWDFGDGSAISTSTNPSHSYLAAANTNTTYVVTLVAITTNSCVDTKTTTVSIYANPTPSFTANEVCHNLSSTLSGTASSSNGNGSMFYQWDLDNNSTIDQFGVPTINYTFPNYGISTISYTVSTNPSLSLTCKASATGTVMVNPVPIPDFIFTNNCINAQPNTFNAGGTFMPPVLGSSIASYNWNYGDGALETIFAPNYTASHSYSNAGSYTVTMIASSVKGCTEKAVHIVEVYQKPDVAIASSIACANLPMSFTATPQVTSGNVTQYNWDFNNNINTIEAFGQTPSFVYSQGGTQTVSLLSITDKNCAATTTKTVYANYNPTPSFTVDKPAGCAPNHCPKFTNTTLPIIGTGYNATYVWIFGDGTNNYTTTSLDNVGHCYDNPSASAIQQYNVSLEVITSAGCKNTLTNNNFITVYPKPIAEFAMTPNLGNVTAPLIEFTNQSQFYNQQWWNFGNGQNSVSQEINPTYFYSEYNATTYTVELIIENNYGCRDTVYHPVEIQPDFTFYISNAFSPTNADGVNDFFSGKGIGIENYEMWIYDRWGEMIYYTDDINNGWDGTVKGKGDAKQDVYVWKVKIKNALGKKHEYVGHVTLL